MPGISRRRVLQVGLLAAAGAAVGAPAWAGPTAGTALTEPTVLASAGGRLQVFLEVAEKTIALGGRTATVLTYNGGVPGPTLRVRPGDRLQVTLVNRLTTATNLHVHGLHVSPQAPGDDPLLPVAAGGTLVYDHQLPADHPPGVYWYHPHVHMTVADQVFAGLYGAIVVEDPVALPVTRERVLVVSDISLDAAGRPQPPPTAERLMGREGALVLVDGQLQPTMTARPGERERWRIVNACASRYLRLRLDGQQLDLLGLDGGRYAAPQRVSELVLMGGNRADVLVTTAAGTSALQVLSQPRGSMPGTPAVSGTVGTVATFAVSGAPAAPLPALPAGAAPRDLRGVQPAARRQLRLGMGVAAGGMTAGGATFTIDFRQFDPARTDVSVQLGTVEEWTIVNASTMDHPFHLHTWPVQLVSVGGRPVPDVVWQDVVNVPAGSWTTVRVPFEDFAGRTVYHCHILDHEDLGMMGVIEAHA
jgi:FtsP/CotA-like multicopper oxidase with cupredoxin domain